jgi:hypothetical protein
MVWGTFWAIFKQTHLVTLALAQADLSRVVQLLRHFLHLAHMS